MHNIIALRNIILETIYRMANWIYINIYKTYMFRIAQPVGAHLTGLAKMFLRISKC